MSESRLVCFDAAGTLIEPVAPVAEIYGRFGRTFGCDLDAETIHARFLSAFSRHFRSTLRTSEENEHACWRALVNEVFGTSGDGANRDTGALFDALYAYYAAPDSWQLRPQTVEWLEAYAASGMRIAIASNFDNRLHGILAAHLPAIPQSHIHISATLGFRKPATEFFRGIELAHDVGPGECLLIGDEDNADRAGAAGAGWQFRRAPL